MDLLASWTQALLAEREEQRQRMRVLQDTVPLKVRRAEGLLWSPVEVESCAYVRGGARWEMACGEGGGVSGCFRNGQAVLLSPVDSGGEEDGLGSWNARVLKSKGMRLDVQLEGDGPEGMAIQHTRWVVEARPDERSFEAMAHALNHWINVDDAAEVARRDAFLGFREGRCEKKALGSSPAEGLNDKQQQAQAMVLEGHDVSLLHGPPGTGKTRTLVSCAEAMVRSGKKLLAAAPSNMAVDVMVERLARKGLTVVRVGHPAKVQDAVQSCTLDAHVERHEGFAQVSTYRKQADECQRQADRFVRNFGQAEREVRREARREARSLRKEADELELYLSEQILREADVVCATLVGCDDRRLRGIAFDVAMVDEAGQALAPATLIPCRRAPKVLLCGDPCQLPPTVKAQDSRVLEQSLMERLVAQGQTPCVMLEVQHRMHEDIMAAGSVHFYGGTLSAHADVKARTLEGVKPWLWVDTVGCGFDERRSEEGGSVSNPAEADFVTKRAMEWLGMHPGMSLGIVAPYAAQVECLKEHWQACAGEHANADVTIHTVDGFQGQERDAMIVSMTRSNDKGEVGFLSESRRIHVAQTRAKMGCMLVGDSVTLGNDPYLAWLVEFAQAQECYDSAWSWMV